MGGFRKTIKLFPRVKLNLSKSGISTHGEAMRPSG
jgi:hypothetical protein